MAAKKTKVVDGFTALKAAQEAAKHGKGDPLRSGDVGTNPPASPGAERKPSAVGSRIGRSVLPTKREVVCPECGFSIDVVGKLQIVVCQRCRHRMKIEDINLHEPWSGEIATGGTVILDAGADLSEGSVVANDVILKGRMSGASVRACRRLTLHPGADPDWSRLQFLDLELMPEVNMKPADTLRGRHLLLHGSLEGRVELEGTLHIHASGDFSGSLRSAGLQVEEGGGLRASLDIDPARRPEPPARSDNRKASP